MKRIIQCIIFSCLLFSCIYDREKIIDKKYLNGFDYRLFQNTPAWELAKAVEDGNESKINSIIAKDSSLINYQEPKYGSTLLIMTLRREQMKSFKILLNSKANINIYDTFTGRSAIIHACILGVSDKYVEMLLKEGAKVNDIEIGERKKGNSTRYTPLIAASRGGNLDVVKLLIKNSADINYQNEYKVSALKTAIYLDKYDIILVLLKNGADFRRPLFNPVYPDKTFYITYELRKRLPKIGSKDHKYKMQIVEFLKENGMDYYSTPIPDFIIERVKKEYPNNWEKYLEEY